LIFLTNRTLESSLDTAVEKIKALDVITGSVVRIRVESLS